ncbi:MAG: Lrp/AsnC family transcriptional regulator, partial [Candidatus Thorarchaeota archaeon]
GLAEYILVATSNPATEATFKKILEKIPVFYFHSTSTGRHEGYFIYTVYPLDTPNMIPKLAKYLKKHEMIEDYYLFDVVDYQRNEAKLSELEGWDWEKWSKSLRRIMAKTKEIKLDLEEFPQTVTFDSKDTLILKHMVENPDITLKELGKVLDLSQPQVHNRVKKLEESGIIRGYKLAMKPYDSGTTIICFFKSKEAGKILLWFDKLPYYHQITIESSSHYFVQVYLPSTETNHYLKHLRNLREYTDEMFVQFLLDSKHKGYGHLIDMYSEDTDSWKLSYEEFVEKIDAILKDDT